MHPDHAETAATSPRRLLLLLVLGAAVPAAAVIALLGSVPSTGPDLRARAVTTHVTAVPAVPLDVDRVLLAVVVVVAVAHLCGAAAARAGQPRVIGQVAAGFLLGPSVLGRAEPDAVAWLHGAGAAASMDLLARLGVVLFAFLIGRELTGVLSRRTWTVALAMGQTMFAVPLLCGVAVGLWLPLDAGAGAGTAHALFVGLAMSASALPVLAHILAELGLLSTPVGLAGVSAAAVGDTALWCLLAVTLCLARGGSLTVAALRLAGAAVAVAVAGGLLRRLVVHRSRRHGDRWDGESSTLLPALLLCVVLAGAVMTDRLGLHAIFGALLVGITVPATSATGRRVTTATRGITEWLFLPIFFTAVGRRADLELLGDRFTVAACLLVLVVAMASKLAAGAGSGLLLGFGPRDSAALGVMTNCRGMTELLLLDVGLEAGIIGPRTFTVFVVMALVSTTTTGPLLKLLKPSRADAGQRPQAVAAPGPAPSGPARGDDDRTGRRRDTRGVPEYPG